MATQMQFRRGTASEWTTADPILAIGELGVELNTPSSADKFKIGDGTTVWSLLTYFTQGTAGVDGVDGVDGTNGTNGTDGADGLTVLNGTAVPTTEGVDGDFYIKTDTSDIYGPKTAGVWGAATSLIGVAGTDGVDGASTTFLELTDAPSTFTGQANKIATVNAGETALEFVSPVGGDNTFLGLTDAPADYTGDAGKLVGVNTGETGLEFRNDVLLDADIGLDTIYIPAAAMTAATTSGAAAGQVEEATNVHNYKTLDFDAAADEFACFEFVFPKSWDEGAITFKFHWSTTATGTTGVAVGLQGVAVADGENSDVAYGTIIVITDDAQTGAGDVLNSAVSTALTIAGTPAAGDLCQFRVLRDVSDANDDMTEDMQLRGVTLLFNTNALKDD